MRAGQVEDTARTGAPIPEFSTPGLVDVDPATSISTLLAERVAATRRGRSPRPTKAFATDIGGPVDVVFVGRTAYVLVTLVSGEIFGEPFGDADDKNGIFIAGAGWLLHACR